MKRLGVIGAVALGLLFAAQSLRAEARLRGGVAIVPIAGDSESLEIGDQLAKGLSRDSVMRVVPVRAVVLAPGGDVEARAIRKIAREAGVDAVVTGRIEERGKDLRLEVALRSGHSGALVSEYELEIVGNRPPSLDPLADAILAGLGYDRVGVPAVASAGPDPDVPEEERTLGRKKEPLSIESEELEVTEQDDRGRRLVFEGAVRVVQGDILLEADRLEAFYPRGASRPAQLEATGSVQVTQGERRARCERATYDSGKDRVSCRGRAELSQGCETVRGSEIEFDLVEERVRVLGSASVVLEDDPNDGQCDGAPS